MTENHWYPHYLGDYIKDTSHLNLTEHGAYRVLLDHYYSTKQPLPANAEQLYRICRAFAEHERAAVDSVMRQYFLLKAENYYNKRADAELAKRKAISKERSKAAKIKHNKHHANAEQLHSKSTSLAPAIAPTATATATAINKEVISSSVEGLFTRIYDFGISLCPQLATQTTSAIQKWIDDGCNIERDILPEIKRIAAKNSKAPKSWSYFTGSIMDAKATRERPPPQGNPRTGKPQEPRKHVTVL